MPKVELFLMATWSRADQTYPEKGAWFGKPIDAMARDVRAGVDKAAAAAGIKNVIPFGEAWTRAIKTGIADASPYDGIESNKLDLWTHDHYHASTAGSYLEALVLFGTITGRDPRSLGDSECSGYELGLSRSQMKRCSRSRSMSLPLRGLAKPAPPDPAAKPAPLARCAAVR
jgi:hypothetical protein